MNLLTLTALYKPIVDAISRALDGTCYVIQGCEPTANGTGLRVDVAAGDSVEGGVAHLTYAGGNVTLSAASSAASLLYRRDIVYRASTGTLTVGAGTAALLTSTTPVAPALPASATLIAICFVAPGQTLLVSTDVEDCRQVRRDPLVGAHQDTEYVTGDASAQGSLTPYSQIINTLHDLVLAVGGTADLHLGRLVSGTGQLFIDMDIRLAEFVAPYAGGRAARGHGMRIYQDDNSVVIEFPITGGIIELAGVLRGNNGANKDIILRNGSAAGHLTFNNAANTLTRFQLNDSGDMTIGGALDHDGSTVGFYGTAPTAKQTGVAVDAAGIHAALVALGLISA